jgi:hypothetical protein
MPTGATAWSDNEILEIKVRLAFVLQIDAPIVTDSDFLLERNDSGALSKYHIRYDACGRRRKSRGGNNSDGTEHGKRPSSDSHDMLSVVWLTERGFRVIRHGVSSYR